VENHSGPDGGHPVGNVSVICHETDLEVLERGDGVLSRQANEFVACMTKAAETVEMDITHLFRLRPIR